MSHAAESERIALLEQTLRECQAYLRRLPLTPATYEKIQEIGRALDDAAATSPYAGASYTPSGIVVVGAVVAGGKVTVYSGARDEDALRLVRSLRNGSTFNVQEVGPNNPYPMIPVPSSGA